MSARNLLNATFFHFLYDKTMFQTKQFYKKAFNFKKKYAKTIQIECKV
jgi:hypothetical protein